MWSCPYTHNEGIQRSGNIAPHILTSTLDSGEWWLLCPSHFIPWERPWYLLNRRLDWTPEQVQKFWRRVKTLACVRNHISSTTSRNTGLTDQRIWTAIYNRRIITVLTLFPLQLTCINQKQAIKRKSITYMCFSISCMKNWVNPLAHSCASIITYLVTSSNTILFTVNVIHSFLKMDT